MYSRKLENREKEKESTEMEGKKEFVLATKKQRGSSESSGAEERKKGQVGV